MIRRRQFLQHSAAVIASGYFVSGLAAQESKSANEKLNLAIVGTANKGWHNVQNLTSQNMVALCDVDANYLAHAAMSFPLATQYRDYRKLLDAETKRIDAVVVSTSDHMHAPITSAALDLGKHVYCEKPLTHTVKEARTVAELAKRKKLATQMGTQIHAEDNYRRVVELVQSGAIGRVTLVHNWCNKGWSGGKFEPWDKPTPAHLDWDLWLGCAKERPYSPNIHPNSWRRFYEFGGGTFGDMACHVMDLPFWALGLTHPTSVVCEGPPVDPVSTPAWSKATFEFPAVGQRPAITMTWSDGGEHFDLVKSTKDHAGKSLSTWGLGILFVGDKGMLAANYTRRQLLPQDRFADHSPPPQTIEKSVGHWQEWVNACKSGSPTTCNFEYSGRLTETVLLGIVAYRSGRKLEWDAASLKAKNSPEADQFITKHYRQGFEVVGIS
ncbi:MAG TPA: Gfo/Idh/MocA family oxidoreductase [Pirellulaceae bacterium]|nr:Gfo/Idh/MocA family oxidoreductase [Pirellulaceae bacterium]